jgi:hypothetical protein
MTRIYGNDRSQQRIQRILQHQKRPRTIALVGPSYLGKHSFIHALLQEELSSLDILNADKSIAGAREALEFCESPSIFGSMKAVLVNDADKLSEPAQDAYLKLCEETPPGIIIIMIVEDDHHLLPALRSRIDTRIKWDLLSIEEMNEYASTLSDHPSMFIDCRRPGLYQLIHGDDKFTDFFKLIVESIMKGADFTMPTPELIKNLPNKPTPIRDAASLVCSFAARSLISHVELRSRIVNFLKFASILIRLPSVNAEIYWQRYCLASSM